MLSVVDLPPKLPGTAVVASFGSPLEFTLSLFGAGFKFGVCDKLGLFCSSLVSGDECCGESECWLALEPPSPPRVEVRGETRPVWRGRGVSDLGVEKVVRRCELMHKNRQSKDVRHKKYLN